MNDRFKLKCFNRLQNKIYEVRSISYYQGNVKRIEVEDNGKILIFDEYDNNIDNCILVQCTGLKDKNGKLIFEGDIVRFSKYHDPEGGDWEKSVVVWGDELDYPAFDLKHTDFGGINGLHYLFAQDCPIEVIGNIYENADLLEEKEDEK